MLFFSQVLNEIDKKRKEKAEKNKKEMEKLSAGATTTTSGLKYLILQKGDGEKPKKEIGFQYIILDILQMGQNLIHLLIEKRLLNFLLVWDK